jgi:hypothetical protein
VSSSWGKLQKTQDLTLREMFATQGERLDSDDSFG